MNPFKETGKKYAEILASPRFHQIVMIGIIQIVAHYWTDSQFAMNVISGILGGSIGVGTVDSVAKKLSGKK